MVNMLQPFLPIFLFSFLLVYHSLSANADCGGELNAEYGRLGATAYDAYYSNGRKCEWKITATQGRKVILILHTVNLSNYYSCTYGKIEVYYSEWSDPLTYCGLQTPHLIVSSNNRMRLVFQSYNASSDSKFSASYISTITGCGGYLNESLGSFVSPGFPNEYPVNSTCWWNITVEEGRRITLFFTQFDVEYLNTCAYDNVTVYDSKSGKSSLLYTECGYTNPAPINSSENKMMVRFKSDLWTNDKGFHAVYFTRVVYCGQPPFPAHGHLISDFTENFVYGGVIQITCDEGYKVRSGNPIRCQYNGQWSGAEPFCEVVSCSNLTDPTNGRVYMNSTTYGSTANYTCNIGFYLDGDITSTCQGTGDWSGSKSSCNRQVVTTENALKSVQTQTVVSCSNLTDPTNGKVYMNSNTYGRTANYTCNIGFYLDGDITSTCQGTGDWSGSKSSCNQILCDNLTAPDHGKFTAYYDGSTPYGQNATFSCNDGYVLDGPATLTCKGDGAQGYFEGQPPICKAIQIHEDNVALAERGIPGLSSVAIITIAILGSLLFFAVLGNSIILCRKIIKTRKSSKKHNRISNIHDYDYIDLGQLAHQSEIQREQPALPSVSSPGSGQFSGPNNDQRQLPEPPRDQPALPSIAMITGEGASFNPGSGQFSGPNTDQRQLPEPPRGIQDGQGNSGRHVSHATNDNEKQKAICGPSHMDDGYLSPSEISIASGRNQAIAHPRTQDNYEDPTQNDGKMEGKEDEEQEDEKTENDYMGLDQETVIKVSLRNSTEKLYTLVDIEQRIAAMTQGTSASCELPNNNGKMTGHNNTDVSTDVIDQGQGTDTKPSVEMNESGPQAQEKGAISSGAEAFLGDKDENDYLVVYPNDKF